jgi:hypothetical protein
MPNQELIQTKIEFSRPVFRCIDKYCLFCSKKLVLNNSRDIKRKNFCSRKCSSKYTQKVNPQIPPKPTIETRRKAGLAIRGEKHHNWIKDRSKVKLRRYENVTDKIGEVAWRSSVFERDNYVCQISGVRGGKLSAHHIKNWADNPELRTEVDNGITMLSELHKRFHHIFGVRNNTKEQLEIFKIMIGVK